MPDLPVTPETLALLSPAALSILSAGGPDAYAALVVSGGGNADGQRLLRTVRPAQLLTRPVVRADAGDAVLAGLWLWHDRLDESHTISQGISSATGSYWHAIMHRREGDFGNAKYWYARCRGHPAQGRAAELAESLLAEPGYAAHAGRLARGGWDPNALVDLAEAAHGRPAADPAHRLAVALQRLEWQALFEDTVRQAVG